jgi:hypothetical protein
MVAIFMCCGVELDTLYVAVIIRRYEAATSNPALPIETRETLDVPAARRSRETALISGRIYRREIPKVGNCPRFPQPSRYCRSEIRRWSASSRTAAKIMAPVAKPCQKIAIRARLRKFLVSAMMITPMIVRRILPCPP